LQKIFNNNNKKEEADRGDTKCIKYKVEYESIYRHTKHKAPESGKARSSVYDVKKLFNSLPRKKQLFNLTFFPIICKQISVIYKALYVFFFISQEYL